jgi:Arc/MetJ-type ribon-helix-helix transcriptional regulator
MGKKLSETDDRRNPISVTLPQSLIETLDASVQGQKTTRSALVQKALTLFFRPEMKPAILPTRDPDSPEYTQPDKGKLPCPENPRECDHFDSEHGVCDFKLDQPWKRCDLLGEDEVV